MAERFRCAAASAGRVEPLIGSASRVRCWVLVEQDGAWGRNALVQSALDPAVGQALADRGRATDVRVLLIRSPNWGPKPQRPLCFLAHTGARSSWIESLQVGHPSDLLDLDWSAVKAHDPPGIGQRHPGGLYLVCTNGRHDACCADFGRPLVRALVEAGTEDVWECSHIGGDRFAGNLVCLPDGTYLGRVAPDEAARVVADHTSGTVRLDYYRGRSCYPSLVQAAELFARYATGVVQVYGIWPRIVNRDGNRLRALFELADGSGVRVQISRRSAGTAQLTCSAGALSPVWEYELEEVQRLDGPVG